MRALDLATALHTRRQSIAGWGILVADVADLEHLGGHVTAYRVQRTELNHSGKEINLVIEYPDQPDGEAKAMTAEQFLDCLMPLASDNPDFAVEASVRVDLIIGGERWEYCHMPVRDIIGCNEARVVILGVEGLRGLAGLAP